MLSGHINMFNYQKYIKRAKKFLAIFRFIIMVYLRKIIFFVLFIHNYTYIYSKGRLGKTISDRPCLILETIGGKTGKLRKNVLVFLKENNSHLDSFYAKDHRSIKCRSLFPQQAIFGL